MSGAPFPSEATAAICVSNEGEPEMWQELVRLVAPGYLESFPLQLSQEFWDKVREAEMADKWNSKK